MKTHYLATLLIFGQDSILLEKDIQEGKFQPYLLAFASDETDAGITALKKRICQDIDSIWEVYRSKL